MLGEALARDTQNAETHNLLEQAFRHYQEALRLNPEHRGAHEYIGEAYLAAGNLAKAEEHLRRLEGLCRSCEEQVDLRKAIEDYKAKRRTGIPPSVAR